MTNRTGLPAHPGTSIGETGSVLGSATATVPEHRPHIECPFCRYLSPWASMECPCGAEFHYDRRQARMPDHSRRSSFLFGPAVVVLPLMLAGRANRAAKERRQWQPFRVYEIAPSGDVKDHPHLSVVRDHQGTRVAATGAPSQGVKPAKEHDGSQKSKMIALFVVLAIGVVLVAAILATDQPSEHERAVSECAGAAESQGARPADAEAFCEALVANEEAETQRAVGAPNGAERAPETPTEAPNDSVLPDVIGMDLQSAQDTLQAHDYRHLESIDDTGRGREQRWDRNWIVVDMSPEPGSRTPAAYEITLFVVKDGEA